MRLLSLFACFAMAGLNACALAQPQPVPVNPYVPEVLMPNHGIARHPRKEEVEPPADPADVAKIKEALLLLRAFVEAGDFSQSAVEKAFGATLVVKTVYEASKAQLYVSKSLKPPFLGECPRVPGKGAGSADQSVTYFQYADMPQKGGYSDYSIGLPLEVKGIPEKQIERFIQENFLNKNWEITKGSLQGVDPWSIFSTKQNSIEFSLLYRYHSSGCYSFSISKSTIESSK
jgi:hypothetical protein